MRWCGAWFSLGHGEVKTLIQSGNAVFSSDHAVSTDELAQAIEARFGLLIDVVLRTPSELQRALAGNPFAGKLQSDPSFCDAFGAHGQQGILADEIGALQLDWRTLTAQVDNLTIHGTEPVDVAPLLAVKRIVIGFKIVSLVEREFNVALIEAEDPRAHLMIEPDGSTNLPRPKTTHVSTVIWSAN